MAIYMWREAQPITTGDTTDTAVARQWPCDSGFHIPSNNEFNSLYQMMSALSVNTWGNYNLLLKMPYSWMRTWENSFSWKNSQTYYWTSTPNDSQYAYQFWFQSSWINNWAKRYYISWLSIRPMKNEAIQPDDARTVLYQPS